MKALLKKEFLLCLHPTCFIFLAFCLFVFIPNYPYEVMFFFSGLSVFFVSITARENGDTQFTVTLPVKKSDAVLARMLLCAILQAALLLLAAATTALKENLYPASAQINLGGTVANIAFLGNGMLLLGVFNAVFFPLYFGAPHKVGAPFLLAAVLQFLLIAVILTLRFAVPFFTNIYATPDPEYLTSKLCVLFVGTVAYMGLTALAACLSCGRFAKVDL